MSIVPRIRVCSVDEEGRFGGPERRIVQIAKALKINGQDVDTQVVYPKDDSERFALELSRGGVYGLALNITRLSKERKVFVRYLFCFLPEVFRLYSFFRKGKFDLVQVNGSQQLKGALAAKLAGIPVIWVLEDTMMAAMVKKICTLLVKYTAAGVIVVGKRVYDYYIRRTSLESKPVIEIHPPVDIAEFNPYQVISGKKLSLIPGRKIVTVSGINPTKGLEYFIEMASRLLKRYKDLSFYIAAQNLKSQRKYYQYLMGLVAAFKLTSENIKFLGMVDDIPSLLQSADIFVFTSVSESGPMAVWEAMAMGKAVVTTDVGSVNQYLVDGESGFIVPIKDPGALVEKVEILLNDPALRQAMGARAQAIAQKKLDVSIIAEKYANFYRKILSLEKNSNNL
jgi:glycosyltransferase involved in cell wall biosynthesis